MRAASPMSRAKFDTKFTTERVAYLFCFFSVSGPIFLGKVWGGNIFGDNIPRVKFTRQILTAKWKLGLLQRENIALLYNAKTSCGMLFRFRPRSFIAYTDMGPNARQCPD